MVQIKGSAIKETIDQIKSRAGEAAFQKSWDFSTKKRARFAKAKSLLSTGTRSTCSHAFWKSRFASLPTAKKRWSPAVRKPSLKGSFAESTRHL
jgi:hypothetical protein